MIGRIARDAKVRVLLLSHRMSRALGREDEMRKEIARTYGGEIRFADDLDCYAAPAAD